MVVVFAEDCKNRGFVCLCVRLVNAVRKGRGEAHKAFDVGRMLLQRSLRGCKSSTPCAPSSRSLLCVPVKSRALKFGQESKHKKKSKPPDPPELINSINFINRAFGGFR